MSTIRRSVTTVGSLYALMRQMLRLNVKTPLLPQEISATSAPDRPLVVSTLTPIAGWPVDHGAVADEAAMLALHTLDSTTLIASPTFVATGDSCLRADDPGWRWHCISGHGQYLSDWERRPLGGALEGLAVDGHTHEMSDIAELQHALAGKQATLSNAAALARITATAGGAPKWDGGDWPGGGGGTGGWAGSYASLAALLSAGLPIGSTAKISGLNRIYACIASPTDSAASWVWYAATSAQAFRFVRFRADYTAGGYLEMHSLRYRSGGVWYPTTAMTSSSTPYPLVVSADSYYDSGYQPYYAFDLNASSRWSTSAPASTSGHWITIDFGVGGEIAPDAVGVVVNAAGYYPRDFAIEGSDTGLFAGEQTELFATTGQTSWTGGVERVFTW